MVRSTRRYVVQHWLVFTGMCWLVSDATASNISPEARSQLVPEGAKVRGEDAKALDVRFVHTPLVPGSVGVSPASGAGWKPTLPGSLHWSSYIGSRPTAGLSRRRFHGCAALVLQERQNEDPHNVCDAQ